MSLKWRKCDQYYALDFAKSDTEVHRCYEEGWAPHVYSEKLPHENRTYSIQVEWRGDKPSSGRRFSIGFVPAQYGLYATRTTDRDSRGPKVGGPKNESAGVRWLLRSNVVADKCTSRGDISSGSGAVQPGAFDALRSGDRIDLVWMPQQGLVSFALNGRFQGSAVDVNTAVRGGRGHRYTIGAVLSPDMTLRFIDASECDEHAAGDAARSRAARCLRAMWAERTYTDATVRCGGNTWHVHRAVLAAASPVFSRMFESEFREGRTSTVEIKDCGQDVIGDMLTFIYTGEVPGLLDVAALDSGGGGGEPRSPRGRTSSSNMVPVNGRVKQRSQAPGAGKCRLRQAPPCPSRADRLKSRWTALLEQSHVYGLDDLAELSARLLKDNQMVDASNIVQLIRYVRSGRNAAGILQELEDLIKADSQLFQALMQSA